MKRGFREALSAHMIIVAITTSVVIATTFALVGPIGFYHIESPLERVAYALFHTFFGCMPALYAFAVLVFFHLRLRKPLEILAGLAVAALFGSFLCTCTIHTIESLTHHGYPEAGRFFRVWYLVAISSLSASVLYFYVVWQRIRHIPPAAEPAQADRDVRPLARDASELRTPAENEYTEPAAEQVRRESQQLVASPHAPRPGTLLKLLPDRLGTDLVYIKSEDHHIEVHTTVGSSLIKMRFSDAVAELDDRGIQVHRSYWVATRHVVRSERSGKRTLLRVAGDHKVPVSATHLPAVHAAFRR